MLVFWPRHLNCCSIWNPLLPFRCPLTIVLLPPLVRQHTRKDRRDLYKLIDADYYGYRDDEDGSLVPAEATAEAEGAHPIFDVTILFTPPSLPLHFFSPSSHLFVVYCLVYYVGRLFDSKALRRRPLAKTRPEFVSPF